MTLKQYRTRHRVCCRVLRALRARHASTGRARHLAVCVRGVPPRDSGGRDFDQRGHVSFRSPRFGVLSAWDLVCCSPYRRYCYSRAHLDGDSAIATSIGIRRPFSVDVCARRWLPFFVHLAAGSYRAGEEVALACLNDLLVPIRAKTLDCIVRKLCVGKMRGLQAFHFLLLE